MKLSLSPKLPLLLLPILLLLPLAAPAQKGIDSLLRVLAASGREDSARANLLLDIGFEYRGTDPEKSIAYYGRGIRLAEQIGWARGAGKGYNNLATDYKARARYPLALEHYFKALGIFEKLGLQRETGVVLMNIGTVFQKLENYPRALDSYRRALAISRETGNRGSEAQLYGTIGGLYFEQNRYDSCLAYNRAALGIFRELNDEASAAWTLANIGDVYAMQGNSAQAQVYHGQAMQIYESRGATDYLIDLQRRLSELYERRGAKDLALQYYKRYARLKDSVISGRAEYRIAAAEQSSARALKSRDEEISRLRKQQKRSIALAGIAVLLALGVAGWALYRLRRLHKAT